MEAAVQSAGVATTMIHSTLITSLVGVRDDPLRQGDTWNTLVHKRMHDLQGELIVPQTVWVTVSVTPNTEDFKPAAAPTIQSITPLSLAPGSTVQMLTLSTHAPAVLPQLVDGSSPFDPANPCPPKTDPIEQQSSSFESCKKTIAPSGICCIPFQAAPSSIPISPTSIFPTSTSPASASASPTSIQLPPIYSSSATSILSSSSSSTSSSSTPSTLLTLSTSSLTAPPTDTPTTNPTTIPPMPSELTTAKTKIDILPILVPCALAAVGIVALSIGYVIWHGKGKRHSVPPPPDMGPKIINGKKVFQAGNFAVAEAFQPGMKGMARKEREGLGEAKGAWKKGYRRYRDSGLPGSGLFGVTKVREISG